MKPWNEPGDWIFRLVPFFIVGVFVLIVCIWAAVGFFGVKAVQSLQGCEPAVITETENGKTSTSIGCK